VETMTNNERWEANVRRNMGEKWWAWYKSLPHVSELKVKVRCPGRKFLGKKRSLTDHCVGCDGENVTWGGDMYDCRDCGIFFSDHAANPPHRREQDP
jgi:acetyltransferase-like isoleucine patch superfamily enzyme